MADLEIQGFCDARFAGVREAFAANFAAGLELGATFALAIEGEFVVDLWAGHADRARTRPWQRDTVASVYSTGKTIAALCGLIALDRGLFELDEPIARYWPEFAAAGKSEIPVRWIFCHATGVPGLEPPITATDLTDWDRACARLAAQAPAWEPGTVSGYHGFSFTLLLGELIQRTSGRPLDAFLRETVTDRLRADFQFRVGAGDRARVAEALAVGERGYGSDSFGARFWEPVTTAMPPENPRWHDSVANGIGNARSLANLGSILACGGTLHGQPFLSEATSRLARTEQLYTHDVVLDSPVRFGLGFGLASAEFPLPFPNAFHWGGYGGSSLIMEPDRKACWSYVPTRLDPAQIIDARGTRLVAAACRALTEIET